MNVPDSSTSSMRRRSSVRRGAYCARTSTGGILGTATESSRGDPAPDHCGEQENHDDGDGVVDVAEPVVDLAVAGPEAPTGGGERERPDRRADRGQDGVAEEAHPKDAGGDRDER